MIILITGVPGAGKTLRAVWRIKKLHEEGRVIYSNIDGLNLKNVQPAPENWTDTPEGSVVVYDEAQRIFPPDAKGRSNRPDIAAMETHRHTGHDLILITQHPNLIHQHVRRLVGLHEHLVRAFGWNMAMVYRKDQAIKVDSKSELRSCETEQWKHPKELFELYKSASVHVEHKRMPKSLLALGGLAVAVAGFAVWGFMRTDFTDLTGQSREKAFQRLGLKEHPRPANRSQEIRRTVDGSTEVVHEVEDERPWEDELIPRRVPIGGCITSARACQCYDVNGMPLYQTEDDCRLMASQPLPIRLLTGRREADREGAPAPDGLPTDRPEGGVSG